MLLGDPSGRDSTRPIISKEEILNNANCIINIVKKILGDNVQIRQCSKNESRRLIDAGAVYINGNKTIFDVEVSSGQIIKIGRNFGKIIITDFVK